MNLKKIALAIPRHLAMTGMAPMERTLLRGAGKIGRKAVFIIGPPRSGTTLLYELLVTRFRFAYFSNASHRFYRTPAAATRFARNLIDSWHGDFTSTHGHIAGWGSPCEAGWIWNRWLVEAPIPLGQDLAQEIIYSARRTVAAISELSQAPFVSKNVFHSVHMSILSRLYPGCVFIEIRRDTRDCARSILRLRRDVAGESGMNEWISVKPPGWETHAQADAVTQACAQIALTRKLIEADTLEVGVQRRHVVSYEDLCKNPERELIAIKSFLDARKIMLEDRAAVPATFFRSTGQPLSQDLEYALSQKLEEFQVPDRAIESPARRLAA